MFYDNSSDDGPRQIAVIDDGVVMARVDELPEWSVTVLGGSF